MLSAWAIKNYASLQSHQQNALLSQVAGIEKALFEDAWELLAIKDVLAQFGAGLLLAVDDKGGVLGYCVYQVVFEMAELLRIGVALAYQGQGIAKALIDELIKLSQGKSAQTLLLEVRADNLPAIGLYQYVGFEPIDVRKNYYCTKAGQIDALIMQKHLCQAD